VTHPPVTAMTNSPSLAPSSTHTDYSVTRKRGIVSDRVTRNTCSACTCASAPCKHHAGLQAAPWRLTKAFHCERYSCSHAAHGPRDHAMRGDLHRSGARCDTSLPPCRATIADWTRLDEHSAHDGRPRPTPFEFCRYPAHPNHVRGAAEAPGRAELRYGAGGGRHGPIIAPRSPPRPRSRRA
jgi:hypothetical protein